jgi:formylmethanofuran dehydrogenase subunit E
MRIAGLALLSLLLISSAARAETPEEWIKLGARVHGGFGAFIPVGIRIGEDAMKRFNAQPRELSVTYYSGEKVPCACSVDGVMLAIGASPGRGTVQVAAEKSPPGTFAVVTIRHRKTGDALKYTVAESWLLKLGQINATVLDLRARYDAVMNAADLFTVEAMTK